MTTDRERYEDLFEACYGPLLAYAIRRAPSAEDAADVVSDTFTVAWRRIGDLPPGDEARLWLYGTARRVIADHRRGSARREALGERLLADARAGFTGLRPVSPSGEEDRLLVALGSLSDSDQELLRLAAWEELDAAQIARVLGISTAATHVRLHRARRRLLSRLEQPRSQPRRDSRPGGTSPGSPFSFARAARSEDT